MTVREMVLHLPVLAHVLQRILDFPKVPLIKTSKYFTDYSYWMDRVANQKVDAITAKRVFDVRIDADAFVAVLNSADDDM